jgi:hypothetical protein
MILTVIFIISILHLLVITLAIFNSHNLAGKYMDTGNYKLLWKFSCHIKSFFICFFLLWIGAVVLQIESETKFFTTNNIGQVLGAGVGLNILATFIWWFFSQAGESARKIQVSSLEKALRKNERNWKRRFFYQRKNILLEDDSIAREEFINSLGAINEPEPIIN